MDAKADISNWQINMLEKEKTKVRLLFYCGGFAQVGGIETFCKNLLSHLQSKGYDCTLLCWGGKSSLIGILRSLGVKIICNPWRWGCKWNVPDWLLLPIGLQQVQNADIVLLSKLFPLKLLKALRQKAPKSTQFVYITAYKPELPATALAKQSLLESLSIFDLVLVQASSFENDLRKIGYQGKVSVIPLIAQQAGALQTLPSGEELKIGFLGRLVEDKNVSLLLKTFHVFQAILLNSSRNQSKVYSATTLHIFGEGHLRQELEQLTFQLGLESSVTFHGNVPNDRVEEAIASCHLFAFTSHLEGQCLAALEILSCGRPIVATNVGAFPDILSDSRLGKLINTPDPEVFANGLLEVIQSLEQQRIFPQSIHSAYSERYAPETLGDRYIGILEDLLDMR